MLPFPARENNKIDKMGKAKKLKVSRSSADKGVSLADQVISDATVKESGRVKVRKRKEEEDEVSVILRK